MGCSFVWGFFLLFLHSTSVVSWWFLLNRAIALFSYIEFQSCLLCLSERVSNLTPLELNLPHTQWERTPTVAGGKEIKCPLGVPALHEVKSHSHWRHFLLRSQCWMAWFGLVRAFFLLLLPFTSCWKSVKLKSTMWKLHHPESCHLARCVSVRYKIGGGKGGKKNQGTSPRLTQAHVMRGSCFAFRALCFPTEEKGKRKGSAKILQRKQSVQRTVP